MNEEKTTYTAEPDNGQDSFLVGRHYTQPGEDVYSKFKFTPRKAEIKTLDGKINFSADNLMFPESWSDNAVKHVADKYFRKTDIPEIGGETDIRQLVGRVTYALTEHGKENGYFKSAEEAQTFSDELTYIFLSQRGSVNSPVWFNAGLYQKHGLRKPGRGLFYLDPESGTVKLSDDPYKNPLCSACFILGLEDALLEGDSSIYGVFNQEGLLFSYGAGSGINRSKLRAKGEPLSGGGKSSGSMSFMVMGCQLAGTVKSGGRSRRAAKLEAMIYDHPEILDFIRKKAGSEIDVRRLVAAGKGIDEAYEMMPDQNANLSVRVDHDFMRKVLEGGTVDLLERKTGKVRETVPAEYIFAQMVASTYIAGDPGIQYHGTINDWNTCLNSGTIDCSNPCSEFMFLDDSACNLSSINLVPFYQNGKFDVEGFKHTARTLITAQDIVVGYAGYPTAKIAENSNIFRPLGLGFANLGSLVMRAGLPYDSDASRNIAQIVTAVMTGEAYAQSNKLAKRVGPFKKFGENLEPFMRVMGKHRTVVESMKVCTNAIENLEEMAGAARGSWRYVIGEIPKTGARNAQVTLLAPTGTIGFMMDCDTTGVESGTALRIEKFTSDGSKMYLVNRAATPALQKLGYNEEQIHNIEKHIDARGHVEGAPHLKSEHYQVFDCALTAGDGTRTIEPMGHLKMCAAVQPLLSGAISKTVNLPSDATLTEIANTFIDGWKMGLKSVSIYRDGCKLSQPLRTKKIGYESSELKRGEKEDLPTVREAEIIEMALRLNNGMEYNLHLIPGENAKGELKEFRLQMTKGGSGIQSLLDAISVNCSTALRCGTPLEELIKKNVGMVTPDFTGTGSYRCDLNFTSLPDLFFTVLGIEYLGEKFFDIAPSKVAIKNRLDPYKLRKNENERRLRFEKYMDQIRVIEGIRKLDSFEAIKKYEENIRKEEEKTGVKKSKTVLTSTGVSCTCGGFMIQDGACMKCLNCGKTGGCAW